MSDILNSMCDKFEKDIMAFGVDAALEYFGTPKELYHLWDELRQREEEIYHRKKS